MNSLDVLLLVLKGLIKEVNLRFSEHDGAADLLWVVIRFGLNVVRCAVELEVRAINLRYLSFSERETSNSR